MRFAFGVFIGFLAIGGSAHAACEEQPAEPGGIGQAIASFSLLDFRGREHSLATAFSQPAGEQAPTPKLAVVAFVGCECPLARQYAPRLAALAKEFQPRGVVFLAVDSNQQDTLAELAEFARAYEIEFPVLKDPGNSVADQFGAVRTPEVFVLDDQRVVRYRGRIDDQFVVGRQRPAATRRDLAVALDELLSGRPVSISQTQVQGCLIGRLRKSDPQSVVTYSNQIARLLDRRCVECHRAGEVAPFALIRYDEVVGWAETMREVVEQGRMPPWFADPQHGVFQNDPRLTDEEKSLMAEWVDAGCPEGDRAQLPKPRQFAAGWQISQPDQVIYIREEPVEVPTEGVVAYQYYTVDPGFREDTWIKAAECRPDNRAVVHHIVAFFVPPGEKTRGRRGAMVGFAPGMPPTTFPEGAAMFVPAGSKIVFQLHYTPNGSPQRDRSSLGLVFANAAEVREKIGGGMAANPLIQIPPGADNHEVHSQHRFDNDVRLLTLTPHMHLRGKAFRYEADYPDGKSEILLDIPRYDFNWQLRYHLAEPKLLPKGTLLRCTAHFDNSAANLANPDPTKTVRWGDQTWEEMMIGYFTTLPARTERPQ
ncbi:MAG TPA: redoxin domain-containing protein [Pirellulales bacterium]